MLKVNNPLQVQGDISLQGNSQALQGSGATVIQGSTPTLQVQPVKPTVVAPVTQKTAPRQVINTTVVKTPAQPAEPRVFKLGNQTIQVDPATGQGSVIQQEQQNSGDQQTTGDPTHDLVKKAGAAGLSTADLATVLGLTTEEKTQIYKDLGIPEAATSAYAPPSKTSEQIYTDAYNAAGLADIKAKFTDLQNKIDVRHQQLTEAVGKENENPWLSEATRVGRLKRLNDQAQSEIGNLVNEAQQYADLYNNGISQVEGVVTRANNDFTANQTQNQAHLTYLEKQADKKIADSTNEKIARYLPDYLTTAANGKKPDTVTAQDGTILRWNSTTGKFDEVYQGAKNQVLSPGAAIVDDNGKVIYKNPTSGGGGSGGNLSSGTLAKVQTMANAFDSHPLVKQFNDVSNKAQSVSQIIESGVGGPGDLSIVYEFMKGLDPSSVVRESEYQAAAKSGNIFAGAFARFNGYLKAEGGILPPQVRSAFLSVLQTKLGVAKTQYDNLYQESIRKINNLTGDTDGADYLTNYGQAFKSADASSSSQEAVDKWVP